MADPTGNLFASDVVGPEDKLEIAGKPKGNVVGKVWLFLVRGPQGQVAVAVPCWLIGEIGTSGSLIPTERLFKVISEVF
jgi:hypothetical protein